jgi:hypothetical protein
MLLNYHQEDVFGRTAMCVSDRTLKKEGKEFSFFRGCFEFFPLFQNFKISKF